MAFLDLVAKYQLSKVLEQCSEFSRRLWRSDSPVARLHYAKQSHMLKGSFKIVGSTYLTPWFLADISYHSINTSSDFNRLTPSDHDFMTLYNEYLRYDETLTSSRYEGCAEEDRLFYILFGLSQKTFWYQERQRLFAMNARFMELLSKLPKSHGDLPNFGEAIEAKYGIDLRTYNANCLAIAWMGINASEIIFPYRLAADTRAEGVDNATLFRLLDDYIVDYRGVRESTLRASQLYLTPVIRTSGGKLVVANTFILARKALTNLYWETRNLFKERVGVEMNVSLGTSFEKYVDELMRHYLPPSKYRRIPRSEKKKRADLVIETKTYRLVLEQKFAMLNISQQDVVFELEKVDRWFDSFLKAATQLDETLEYLGKARLVDVKLILFFDNLYFADGLIRDRIRVLSGRNADKAPDLDNTYMIGIDELEDLVQLIKIDEDFADKVIAEKMGRHKRADYSRGVEFSQIMEQMGAARSDYVQRKSSSSKDL